MDEKQKKTLLIIAILFVLGGGEYWVFKSLMQAKIREEERGEGSSSVVAVVPKPVSEPNVVQTKPKIIPSKPEVVTPAPKSVPVRPAPQISPKPDELAVATEELKKTYGLEDYSPSDNFALLMEFIKVSALETESVKSIEDIDRELSLTVKESTRLILEGNKINILTESWMRTHKVLGLMVDSLRSQSSSGNFSRERSLQMSKEADQCQTLRAMLAIEYQHGRAVYIKKTEAFKQKHPDQFRSP